MNRGIIKIYVKGQRSPLSFWLPKVQNVKQYAVYRYEKYFKNKFQDVQGVYLSVRDKNGVELENIKIDK